jgi:TonB-dependent starch-binding outer membrane protein SusC
MKLTTFLLLAFCLQISAKGVSQQISLTEKNAPLKKVLRQVARQAGVSIVYDEALLSTANPVTIDVKDASLQEALTICLANQPFSYAMDGQRILVRRLTPKVEQDTMQTVKGRVTDNTGAPVPGAGIRVKGSNTGTVTDANGNYTLRVPNGSSLEVNAMGFSVQSKPAAANVNFQLAVSETALTETVVVGYGVQKKSVVTGAISSVKASDLESQPVTRIEQSLQGRTAGVTIAASAGQPGSAATIRVRGVTSLNNSDPLLVVDGVVVDNGGIGYLNQSDIESMEVLKDAASQAIYGARAASGVILITTKKGKAGSLKVGYNGYFGTSAPARKLKMLNATEYATLMNEASVADGGQQLYADPKSLGQGTDWQSLIFNNDARRQDHEVSLSGGNEKSTFYTSFGFMKQDGIVATDISKYQRTNVRVNSTHKISKYVTFGENLGYSYEKTIGLGNTNSEFGGPLSSAINLDPITKAVIYDPAIAGASPYSTNAVERDSKGNPFGISSIVGQEITNPLAYIKTKLGNYNWSHNIVGNAYLEIKPIKGLTLRSTLGTKMAFWGTEAYTPIYYLNSSTTSTRTNFNRQQNVQYAWNLENTASYTQQIQKHNVTLLVGQGAYMDNNSYGTNVTFYDIPAQNFHDASLNYKTASTNRTADGNEGILHTVASLFGRLDYNYDEKYLLQGVLRRDGSSRFGPTHKYGVFPSVSAGWVASREDFWPQNSVVNFLKVRGGIGTVGNDNIGDFAYVSVIGSGRNYAFGQSGNYAIGNSPNALSNPDIKWESTTQTNVGLDATLFKNLNVTFEWFKKRTTDILQTLPIPGYIGTVNNPAANVGAVNNTGVELQLGYHVKVGEVDLSANGSAAYVKNTVTELAPFVQYLENGPSFQSTSFPIVRTAPGHPINEFYGFKTDGIFQTQADVDSYVGKNGGKIQPNAAPGDFRWKDVNGDGIIDDKDRTWLGNSIPTWTFGGQLSAAYKGFDAIVFVQGSAGAKIFQGLHRLDIQQANYQTKELGRWTGAGTSNDIPRMSFADPNHNRTNPSDYYLESGNYMRLKTFQIGYSLPGHMLKTVGIERFRIYVLSENLFTFTKYTGYDPEIGGSNFGVDKGFYPQARSFMLGVNATF